MRKNKLVYGLLFGMVFSLSSCNLVGINTSNKCDNTLEQLYDLLKENYYIETDDRALLDGMISGLTEAFDDPFTYYTSSAKGESQDYSSSGVGLGFSRTIYYGEAYVNQVMKNSPAEKAGLKDKDVIYKLKNTGEEEYILKDHSYSDWTSHFLGEEGSQVEVYVKRKDNEGVYREIKEPLIVTRGKYDVDKARLLSLTSTKGYSEAYVELTSFLGNESSHEVTPQGQLKDIFDKEIFINGTNKLDHLIVDLRGNGGGYVDNCIKTLGLFIPKGQPTGYYLYQNGTYEALVNNSQSVQYTSKIEKITCIVDSNTASAGESFVVGLRDSEYTKDKVEIVGQVSYGKGIAQTFVELFDDGSLIRMTFAKVTSPSKKCINKRGIVPDRFLGEEYIPYEEYVRYIEGVENNSSLSLKDKEVVKNRISILLNKSYSDFDSAVLSFKNAYKINDDNSSLYNLKTSEKLQDEIYDNIIMNYANIYTGHIEGVTNNDYLSSEERIFLKEKINFLLNSSYESFDKALKAFQKQFEIINEDGIYDKTSADLLQGKVMDIHLVNYEQVVNDVKR